MLQPRRRTALKASAALIGAPLVLASCGDGPAGGGDPDGDLVVWFPGTNPAEQAFINDVLVPAYTERTGRGAAVTFIDWGDMSTRLNAGFSSGTGPDVYGHGPAARSEERRVGKDDTERRRPELDWSSDVCSSDLDLVVWFPGANPAEQAFINAVLVPAYTERTGRGAAVTFIDWGDMSTRLNAGFSSGTGPDVYGHGPAA